MPQTKQVIGDPLVIGGRVLSLSRAIRAGDTVYLTGQIPMQNGVPITTGTIEEQTRAVAQINAAIGEVARSATATSGQAEQLAAGAAELQASSEAMRAEINHFHLRAAPVAPPVDLAGLPAELMDRISAMLHGRGVSLPPAMAKRA